MKKTIEVQGKKVEDAIAEGLKILGMTMDEVDIKILSSGGLFKKAKVELSYGEDEPQETPPKTEALNTETAKAEAETLILRTDKPMDKSLGNKPVQAKKETHDRPNKPYPKKEKSESANVETDKPHNKADKSIPQRENKNQSGKPFKKNFDEERPSAPVTEQQENACKNFLENLLPKMGIEGSVSAKEDNGLKMNIDTSDSAVIGHRGEVLDALQYLTSLVLNANGGKDVIFNLDALGYREKRIGTLTRIAERAAEKCVRIGKKVSLESMNSSDRRIIHAALSNRDDVYTRSEGHEPSRRIAILPVRK